MALDDGALDQNKTGVNGADHATIERRIRISPPGYGNANARLQERPRRYKHDVKSSQRRELDETEYFAASNIR